jgi:ATP phosphoribosyltransferase
MIVIDGNDGLGKSTLVKRLGELGYQVADRGMPTKATDTGVPEHLPMGERYVILDAPVEVSRARLEKAGRDMNEKYHTVEGLTHYRQRFKEVAEQLGVPLIDASGSPDDVLDATLTYLGAQPRRWCIRIDAATAGRAASAFLHTTYGEFITFRTKHDADEACEKVRADNAGAAVDGFSAKTFEPHLYSTLRVGIPKGRLQEQVWRVMQVALKTPRMPFVGRCYRDLFGNVEVVLVKPRSIPQMLALGMIDVGFCGLDLVEESGYGHRGAPHMMGHGGVDPIINLDLNRVQMVAAAADPNILKNPPSRPITIATEFPNIADRWASAKGLAHICVNTWGSTEAWVPDLCDVCIDVVETGETMRANGLTILDEILSSSTHLCVRRGGIAGHHELLAALGPLYVRSGPLVHVTSDKKEGGSQ